MPELGRNRVPLLSRSGYMRGRVLLCSYSNKLPIFFACSLIQSKR